MKKLSENQVVRGTKRDWMESVSFTPLHGKKMKCNSCWEKVTRNWVNSHKKLHLPKKVEDAASNINKKIDILLGEIINLETQAKSSSNLENLLIEANVKLRVDNIFKRVNSLPKEEQTKITHDLWHLEQYM